MAHGFGGTRDTGLLGVRRGLRGRRPRRPRSSTTAGSAPRTAHPRQLVSLRRQRADYRAAIARGPAARRGRPRADRAVGDVVLRRPRLPGGRRRRADRRGRLADAGHGRAGRPGRDRPARRRPPTRAAGRPRPPRRRSARCSAAVRTTCPSSASPARRRCITSPGALEGYQALAGPTWRNEVCARVALEVAFNRPIRFAVAAARPAARAGRRARLRRAAGRRPARGGAGRRVRRGPQLPGRPLRRLRRRLAAAGPRRPDPLPRPAPVRPQLHHLPNRKASTS